MVKQFEWDYDSISNDGERLIPFISHENEENVRHMASHEFFRKIICEDLKRFNSKHVTLLDLGFGAGYASYLYASIPEVEKIDSVDVSDELVEWAKANYASKKIKYITADARKLLRNAKPYSYIVTRHVLEHIPDGLNTVKEEHFSKRLCINVPYNEPEGNPYHLLSGIQEKHFPKYKNVEFFYEDLNGITYNKIPKNVFINSIICIASKDGLSPVAEYFSFPLKPSSVVSQFASLSVNNDSFLTNVLNAQSSNVRKIRDLKSKNSAIEVELNSAKKLNSDLNTQKNELSERVDELNRQIDYIHKSKKWRYATKVGIIFNRVKEVFVSKKRAR